MAKISPVVLLGVGALGLVAMSGKKKTKVPMVDPVIQAYQINLNVLGYYNGPMDGKMSDEFKMSVANFQKDLGLPTTGILDAQTRQATVDAIKLKALVAQAGDIAKAYGGSVYDLIARLFG